MSQAPSSFTSNGKAVHLPLENRDKCAACGKSGQVIKLRCCTSCAEALYCTEECQRAHWKEHKTICGVTDRLDLKSYYPFIAAIMNECHSFPGMLHPALHRQIINSPNPHKGDVVDFPNGESAKLVLLGPEISMTEMCTREWWPTGQSAEVRRKLMRRIVAEGLVLPIVLATTIALLSEMYTTTSSRQSKSTADRPAGGRRVRLTYKNSPIADFGIVVGSARVVAQDRLAYYDVENNTFLMGQNPEEHYWLYFKTLAGEEQLLDCNSYTFNFCILVMTSAYTQGQEGIEETDSVPAFLFDSPFEKMMPTMYGDIWKIRKRFSVLREPRLHELVQSTGNAVYDTSHMSIVYEIMDKISGKEGSTYEKRMMREFMSTSRRIIGQNIAKRAYTVFPKEPQIGIDTDPEEKLLGEFSKEESDQFDRYLKKWARRYRKGQISSEQWLRAYHAWSKQPFAVHMKSMDGSV